MVFSFGWSAQGKSDGRPKLVQRRSKPKVGLALSAGAARGWSQIGVLRELISSGFEPDIVVGSSIGAVIGGCYSAGRLDQIEAFARSLNKRRVFGLMDFTLSGMGLLAGSRLKARLDKDLGETLVETLPIRFATVATEVQTGHEVWLAQGLLVDAITASYALPGLFQPVNVGGRWLMDGALVNPVPVSVCRALGAEIVIAVNVISETLARPHAFRPPPGIAADDATPVQDAAPAASSGLLQGWWGSGSAVPRSTAEAVPGIASVLIDAFNITQDRIARSRLAGDPPDVTISVKCGKIGLFEFHRASELIAIGRDGAQKAMPDLREYIDLYPMPVAIPPGS